MGFADELRATLPKQATAEDAIVAFSTLAKAQNEKRMVDGFLSGYPAMVRLERNTRLVPWEPLKAWIHANGFTIEVNMETVRIRW